MTFQEFVVWGLVIIAVSLPAALVLMVVMEKSMKGTFERLMEGMTTDKSVSWLKQPEKRIKFKWPTSKPQIKYYD